MKRDKDGLIRYIRPVIPTPEEWAPYLRESYEVGYFANTGPAARAFESRLRQKYGRTRAVVTGPNATNSLVASLQALGVRGKVLTPSYTFTATAQAILMAGGEPVFCDIAPDIWAMDPVAAAKLLERGGITAMLHMRPYGLAHDAAPLERLAKQHSIPLIIDSASGLGSAQSINGSMGQQGDIEVFSLHATKVFAIGEGGVAFMRPELEETFRRVSNFGIRYPDDIVSPGSNSKLSDFQAAVALAVLDRIDGYIAVRQGIARLYHTALAKLPGVRAVHDPMLSPWQSYPVLLSADRDASQVMQRALDLGLELKRGYYRPLHQTAYFRRYAAGALPVTEDIGAHVLCLPAYSDMTAEDGARVLEIFQQALRT